jgi:putative resolvase
MNGHRRKLTRLLSDLSATVIVVEHGDRLTGSGSSIWPPQAVVLDETETTDDLGGDVTGVVTSLCGRRYGRRPASRRAARAVAAAAGRGGDEEAGRAAG